MVLGITPNTKFVYSLKHPAEMQGVFYSLPNHKEISLTEIPVFCNTSNSCFLLVLMIT